MENVSQLLQRKYPQFNTVSPGCRVSDALYQMRCENVDYLIVLEDNRFKGLLTDHDIASRILFESRPLNKILVSEFMSTTVPVTTPDASLQGCLQLAERFGARHIAVFDRFDFKGVVSAADLVHEAFDGAERKQPQRTEPHTGYPWTY